MDDYKATKAQNDFAAVLSPRDDCCIFTDIDASIVAAHIIPFRKQDEVSDYQLHIITIIILSCYKLQLKSDCRCRADWYQ